MKSLATCTPVSPRLFRSVMATIIASRKSLLPGEVVQKSNGAAAMFLNSGSVGLHLAMAHHAEGDPQESREGVAIYSFDFLF